MNLSNNINDTVTEKPTYRRYRRRVYRRYRRRRYYPPKKDNEPIKTNEVNVTNSTNESNMTNIVNITNETNAEKPKYRRRRRVRYVRFIRRRRRKNGDDLFSNFIKDIELRNEEFEKNNLTKKKS